MTPLFQIFADGADITRKMQDRKLDISVSTETDPTQDTLEILLDDRDNAIITPTRGASLKVLLGYRETALHDFGTYTVDELEINGFPSTLRITAKAANVSSQSTVGINQFNAFVRGFKPLFGEKNEAGNPVANTIKDQRSRSWHNESFDSLVTTIASEHGYLAKIHPALSNIAISHLDQMDESDMNLLTRLATQYDALLKIADSKLILLPRGSGNTASGDSITPLPVFKEQVTSFRMTLSESEAFGAVTAHWKNLDSAERLPVTVGSGTPAKILKDDYVDEEAARYAAQAELKRMKRGQTTASIDMPGQPSLTAGMHIDAQGFRDDFNGLWHIKKASHSLSSKYTTSLELEAPTP